MSNAWVYWLSETDGPVWLYTVGYYDPDGKRHTDSDGSKEECAARCAYLNGGGDAARALRGTVDDAMVERLARATLAEMWRKRAAAATSRQRRSVYLECADEVERA